MGFLPYEIYIIKNNQEGYYLSYLDLTMRGNIPYDDLVYVYNELTDLDMKKYKDKVISIKTIYSDIQGFGNKIKSKVRKSI